MHMDFQYINAGWIRGLINEIRIIKSQDIFFLSITLRFEFEYYFKE